MTQTEKRSLFDRYKHDLLFRQWLPTLGQLCRAGWCDEVEIWHEAECALSRLKAETDLRDMEVELIYSDLCKRHSATPVLALAVMAVLFTCLADAAPDADKAHENPHAPICIAICAMLGEDKRFLALLDAFAGRVRGNRGEKVVLPVTDYIDTAQDEVPANETNDTKENAPRMKESKREAQMDAKFKQIEEQITALKNIQPTTQNIFQPGANQINQSTMQSPTFGTLASSKALNEN